MNMSYCRFQNTSSDLGDCLDAIYDAQNGDKESKLSRKEAWALLDLLEKAQMLLDYFNDPGGFHNLDDLKDEAPYLFQ